MTDLLLAHDGDVVLGLAGDDAGVAADAGRLVDHHAPGVFRLFIFGIEGRQLLRDDACSRVDEARDPGRIRASVRTLHQVAAFHAVVVLRDRQSRDASPVGFNSTPPANHSPLAGRRAIGVHANVRCRSGRHECDHSQVPTRSNRRAGREQSIPARDRSSRQRQLDDVS